MKPMTKTSMRVNPWTHELRRPLERPIVAILLAAALLTPGVSADQEVERDGAGSWWSRARGRIRSGAGAAVETVREGSVVVGRVRDARNGDLHIPIRYLETPMNYDTARDVARGAEGVPGWIYEEIEVSGVEPDTVLELYHELNHSLNTLPPPFMVEGAFPDLLIAHWALARETVDGEGVVDRAVKEVLIGELSVRNGAGLIRSLHSLWLKALGHEELGEFFADDVYGTVAPSELPDRFGDMVELARAVRTPGGRHDALVGYSEEERAEILGAALAFDFLSRTTVVFTDAQKLVHALTGSDSPLWKQRAAWFAAEGTLVGLTGRRLGAAKPRGESLAFRLSPSLGGDLPEDVAWAAPIPEVARTVGALVAAGDARGEGVDPAVKSIVEDFLEREFPTYDPRDGYPVALVEEKVADLPEGQRVAARLALQVVTWPQAAVDEGTAAAFLATGAGDREIISLVTWAGLQAARKVCEALAASAAPPGAVIQAPRPVPALDPGFDGLIGGAS